MFEMERFLIRLARKTIRITCFEERSREYCKDFIVSDELPFDYDIVISKEDIQEETKNAEEQGAYASIELTAIYRKIVEELINDDILLFHCSAVRINGKGYLFAAPSGTGKSTHVKLLRKYLGESVVVYINDDKPLIHVTELESWVYGTPWNGKERKGEDTDAKIAGIAILQRSEKNSIDPLSKEDAFPHLIAQTYRPKDPIKLIKTLNMLDHMISKVPVYLLKVNMDLEAAATSYHGMVERGERSGTA